MSDLAGPQETNWSRIIGWTLVAVLLAWAVGGYAFVAGVELGGAAEPAPLWARSGVWVAWASIVIAGCAASALVFRTLVGLIPTGFTRMLGKAPLTAAFGMLVILIYVLAGVFADLIAPFGETYTSGPSQQLVAQEGGDPAYLLGTDGNGRDVLSLLIYGARNTVGIALLTTFLAFLVGTTIGFMAALFGGWFDQIVSRIVDAFMAIPQLIFALLLITVFKGSLPDITLGTFRLPGDVIVMCLVIAFLDSTRVFRLARAVAGGIVVMDYIEAARLRGEGMRYLVFREILPNAMAPLVAEFGLRFCFVFLTISALSFLGLGLPAGMADWATMVKENASFIGFASFDLRYALFALIPAGAIALLTISVNFVVDWQLHKASGLKE